MSKFLHPETPELTSEPVVGFIGVGMNLGNEAVFPGRILMCLNATGFAILACSSWHVTVPLGPDQPVYLNGIVKVEAATDASNALRRLRQVEQAMGRQRIMHWGPRVVDLDLLVWGTTTIQTPELMLPHPGIVERGFVLFPWEEIAQDFVLPGLGKSVSELAQCLRRSS